MRSIQILMISLLACFASVSFGQAAQAATPENPGTSMSFRDLIQRISEKDQPEAQDFLIMAMGTVQVAKQTMQTGQGRLPDSAIHDALDAVDEGERIDPTAADWEEVRKQLRALLENPEQQQQQQDQQKSEQDQKSQQNQQGEGQDSENSQSQQQGEKGEEGQESQSDQQSGQEEQQEGAPNPESGDESQQQEQGGEGSEKPEEKMANEDGARVGDLGEQSEKEKLELSEDDPSPKKSSEEMQTVGGQQGGGKPIDAEKAAMMQMLEQLKQQDDPAKLFQLLKEAQSGEKAKPQPNAKDW